MNNEIQKLIQWAEVRKKAFSAMAKVMESDRAKYRAEGHLEENAFFIRELELLLKDESKQPQPPDCANTMLGEVPHVVNDQPGENLKAVEGATPVVRQNEQPKEVCHCIWPIRDTNDPDLCAYCLKEFVG